MLNNALVGVVATPEATVEYSQQPLFQRLGSLTGIFARLDKSQRLVVGLNHSFDILATTSSTLDFQHSHSRSNKLVEKIDRTQILWREDIATIYIEHLARIFVLDSIFSAANLTARTTISRASGFVLAQVALTRDGHTQRSVGKHLYLDQLAFRATDILLHDGSMHLGNLLERQLTSQYHHIGPLREELYRLRVGDVALSGDMYLDTCVVGVGYNRQVRGDDGIDTHGLCLIYNLVHRLHLIIIDDGIDREVGFNTRSVGNLDNLLQVGLGEVCSRGGAHIESANAEIYRVGTGIYRSVERLVTPYRGHNLYICAFHILAISY